MYGARIRMMEEGCRGGRVLGKLVSYLHNYLEAAAEVAGLRCIPVCSGIVHRDSAG